MEHQDRNEPHPYSALILDRIEELLPDQDDNKVRGMIFTLACAVADTEYGNRIAVLEKVINLKECNGKYACIFKLLQRGEIILKSRRTLLKS